MSRNGSKHHDFWQIAMTAVNVLCFFAGFIRFHRVAKPAKKNVFPVDFYPRHKFASGFIPMNTFQFAFSKSPDWNVSLIQRWIRSAEILNSVIHLVHVYMVDLIRHIPMMPKKYKPMLCGRTITRDSYLPVTVSVVKAACNFSLLSASVRSLPNQFAGFNVIKQISDKFLSNRCFCHIGIVPNNN